MDRKEILGNLTKILADVIDNEDLVLEESSSPLTVEDWDSLAHYTFVMEIQKEYGIKFSSSGIQSWKNVGDIIDSIESLL